MANKEDYCTPVIKELHMILTHADSAENFIAAAKEAASLPYYARAYIADAIEKDFSFTMKHLNTNGDTDRLKKVADLDVERVRFVIDTLGKQASLPVRIFAHQALGGDTPAPERLTAPAQTPVEALCETAKAVRQFAFDNNVKEVSRAFEYVLIPNFAGLEARTLQQPPLTRLFIAEQLQDPFLQQKRDTIARGTEEKRKHTRQFPPSAYECTVNAKILDLVVRIKGDATPLFIRQLARNLAPFQDKDYEDVPKYIDLFFDAYEATEDGVDPATRKKEALETQISRLKALRPKTPSLKLPAKGL